MTGPDVTDLGFLADEGDELLHPALAVAVSLGGVVGPHMFEPPVGDVSEGGIRLDRLPEVVHVQQIAVLPLSLVLIRAEQVELPIHRHGVLTSASRPVQRRLASGHPRSPVSGSGCMARTPFLAPFFAQILYPGARNGAKSAGKPAENEVIANWLVDAAHETDADDANSYHRDSLFARMREHCFRAGNEIGKFIVPVVGT